MNRHKLAAYAAWCERVGTDPMLPAALADRFDDGGDAEHPGMRVGDYVIPYDARLLSRTW